MSLTNVTYGDSSVASLEGAKAGDAAEMESRLTALVAASASPADLSDLIVTGVGTGPEWQAHLLFGTSSNAIPRADVRFAAAEDPSAEGAMSKLLERIDAINAAEASGLLAIAKLEIAGNGTGEKVMAVAFLAAN